MKRKVAILFFLFLTSGTYAEMSGNLNYGLSYGPETILGLPLNFQLDVFPIDRFRGYLGASASWLFTLGHLGLHVGYAWDWLFLETSVSVSNISTYEENPVGYSSLTVNPKVGVLHTLDPINHWLGLDLKGYAKLGYSFFLRQNDGYSGRNEIVNVITKFPYNVEMGINTELF